MTYKEKIIATAYTGIMFVDGSHIGDVYAYEEEKLGYGVLDIMHASEDFNMEVRNAIKDDFLAMLSGKYEKEEITKEEKIKALNELINEVAQSPNMHKNDYLYNILKAIRKDINEKTN